MDDIEYAKLNHKKRRGKPQQTKPYLEDPTTIVYADIKTSRIQLPVEDPNPDVTENTGRSAKFGNIVKILTVLIILALSCALAVLICKLNQGMAKEHQCSSNCSAKNLANYDAGVSVEEIKKQLCVNNSYAGCVLCPDGWLRHREICYYFSSGGDIRTWNKSREGCEEMGADLLVIEDRQQQEFINTFSKGQAYEVFWIGLYRDGDGWRRVDGHLYNTGLFNISGSSGDCVTIQVRPPYSYDKCEFKHSWICQKRSLKI